MTLASLMIAGTFVLGVVLVLFGVFALFRKAASGGGGSLKLLGIEVSGKNGATLVLLVGAAFVASGFGWASTQTEAELATAKAEEATQQVAQADADAQRLEAGHAALVARIERELPKEKVKELEPQLRAARSWHPPPHLLPQAARLAPPR